MDEAFFQKARETIPLDKAYFDKHGFYAIGNVLCGEVNPSGRLADTYAAHLLVSPMMENFGSDVYYDANGEFDNQYDTKIPYTGNDGTAKERPIMFVGYEEGIYMGYRFYETAAADGFFGAQSAGNDPYYNRKNGVVYPSGYGPSYTAFAQTITSAQYADGTFTMTVDVTNTGGATGKDVVELYVEAPYTPGGIEKSKAVLCGFDKTEVLAPGSTETVTITVNQEDIASYDDTVNKSYVLDAGDYTFYLGTWMVRCTAATPGPLPSRWRRARNSFASPNTWYWTRRSTAMTLVRIARSRILQPQFPKPMSTMVFSLCSKRLSASPYPC